MHVHVYKTYKYSTCYTTSFPANSEEWHATLLTRVKLLARAIIMSMTYLPFKIVIVTLNSHALNNETLSTADIESSSYTLNFSRLIFSVL